MSSVETNKKSLRDGYGEAILELGERFSNVVVLSSDFAESTRVSAFEKKFPNRFVQVGVAEQNMAGIAAGLSQEGKIAFASTAAVFSPGGNWHTIRTSICYSNENVKIVGTHVGFSDGMDGATHEAMEDVACMRVLPNMTVVVPADFNQAKKATFSSAEINGPVYIRITRDSTDMLTKESDDFKIGKADILQQGNDLTIIFCGPIGTQVIKASEKLKKENNLDVEIINSHTIKPLDDITILNSARKTGKVVTVEEHQIFGGLGSAVAETLSQNSPLPLKIIGMKDTFGESGNYSELLKKYELDSDSIYVQVTKFLESM